MESRIKTFTYRGLEFGMRVPCKQDVIIQTAMEPIFLDIETSNNHAEDPSKLITWVSSIQVLFKNEYHLFRYPEELTKWLNEFYWHYGLEPYNANNGKLFKKKVIIYIHNASYDLSYLVPYFMRYLVCPPGEDRGIIEENNQFLTYVQGPFEFRCTYRLTGMSLEKWSESMNVEHKKQVGLYDYSRVIYQDSELSEAEKQYDKYDVLSMQESLAKWNKIHGDTMVTVPLTMTGYTRRDLRRSCNASLTYRDEYFLETRLDPELYFACWNAYAGGYTHQNRFLKNKTIKGTIGHRDFKSHYPSQMTCRKFPLGRPYLFYNYVNNPDCMTIERVLDLYPDYSTITVLRIFEATIKDPRITMPFMQYDKLNFNEKPADLQRDNGRVLHFRSEEGGVLYVDNLTLNILVQQYDLDYTILKSWKMENKELPEEIIRVVDKYFKGKSDKKAIVKEYVKLYGEMDDRTRDAEIELMLTKILLNSAYGCVAMNPLRNDWALTEDMEFECNNNFDTFEAMAEPLDNYYAAYYNFLPYQVGIFITAYARYELFLYIEAIGYEKCLYSDTDSIFYLKDEDTERAINDLNAKMRAKAHYVVLANGEKEYYDEFTAEPDCHSFKGLHSKCYGVITSKDELKLTIAGVPSRTLIAMVDNKPLYLTREDEMRQNEADPYKALDKLEEGLEFNTNTGLTALYIGAEGYKTPRVPKVIMVDGHEIHTAGGCVLRRPEAKVVHDALVDPWYIDHNIMTKL